MNGIARIRRIKSIARISSTNSGFAVVGVFANNTYWVDLDFMIYWVNGLTRLVQKKIKD